MPPIRLLRGFKRAKILGYTAAVVANKHSRVATLDAHPPRLTQTASKSTN